MTPAVIDLIRGYYRAYETGDRAVVEKFLSPDFTFSSPLDDRIDRAAYFARCWQYHEQVRSFQLRQVAVTGNHALIRYRAETTDGNSFCNVEHFELDDPHVTHIDVYFGSLPDSNPS